MIYLIYRMAGVQEYFWVIEEVAIVLEWKALSKHEKAQGH